MQLTARVVPPAAIGALDRRRMYALFERYYEATSFDAFCRDLGNKDDVILLVDPAGELRGFSTLARVDLEVEGRRYRGVFSGDTIVDRACWGQPALQRAFLRYMFREKLRRPWAPLWWFLISKGYKTYLLLANNFPEHYPRYERATPAWAEALLDAFGAGRFGDDYDPAAGLIRFAASRGQLRPGVADITAAELSDPRIAYFQERNPTWAAGTELCCVARMTWTMPLRYALKRAWRRLARLFGGGGASRAERQAAGSGGARAA